MMRLLGPGDIDRALELSTGAGWNQTSEDWRRLLDLQPDGCFGIECDGRLAATATLLCHGQDLAWIGMVLTHPDYQRRGYARRLLEATLCKADELGVRGVKLDATDAGRPLYLSLGFRDEQPVERWQATPGVPASRAPSGACENLDWEAFGADRSRFLAALDPPLANESGFVYARAGIRARYLGPCVAASPAAARPLIAQMLGSHPGEPWFWDLLIENENAAGLARSLGFRPVRRLTRMVRGPQISRRDDLVYAIGGFEAG